MKYKIFKIKEGKLQQWKDWCEFLRKNEKEVFETMKEEKVTRELAVRVGDTVLYVMEGEMLPSTNKDLNIQHQKNLVECLEPVTDAEVLFDFKLGN